jgi:hypothetical protein
MPEPHSLKNFGPPSRLLTGAPWSWSPLNQPGGCDAVTRRADLVHEDQIDVWRFASTGAPTSTLSKAVSSAISTYLSSLTSN